MAKTRLGDTAQGDADLSARKVQPDIDVRAGRIDLAPDAVPKP